MSMPLQSYVSLYSFILESHESHKREQLILSHVPLLHSVFTLFHESSGSEPPNVGV
jgi:hypothetical protein